MGIWLSWVDDFLALGERNHVTQMRNEMMALFECDDLGTLNEYVGTKIETGEKSIKVTQPVLIQCFEDEFGVKEGAHVRTPAIIGQQLEEGVDDEKLDEAMHKRYRSGVGKLVYLARWSRPDILNQTRSLARYLKGPTMTHYKAMLRCMQYCVTTSKRGLSINPNIQWDGSKDYEFCIEGYSDAAYNSCPDTSSGVSGCTTTFIGVPVITRSSTQRTAKLSVCEAELDSAVETVQDMLFTRNIVESMELKVKLPMILHTDNKGVEEIVNGWTVGGRTRHIRTKHTFLRELKEQGILRVIHTKGEEMRSDLFTKNLPGHLFDRHIKHYVTDESPIKQTIGEASAEEHLERESVGGHLFARGTSSLKHEQTSLKHEQTSPKHGQTAQDVTEYQEMIMMNHDTIEEENTIDEGSNRDKYGLTEDEKFRIAMNQLSILRRMQNNETICYQCPKDDDPCFGCDRTVKECRNDGAHSHEYMDIHDCIQRKNSRNSNTYSNYRKILIIMNQIQKIRIRNQKQTQKMTHLMTKTIRKMTYLTFTTPLIENFRTQHTNFRQ